MSGKQSGMTLIEVLAAVTLSSFLIVIIFSLLFFIKNKTDEQQVVIDNQTNLRLAMSVINQEIRKYNASNIQLTKNNTNTVMTIIDGSTKRIYQVNSHNQLVRNEEVIAANVAHFQVTKDVSNPNKYTVSINANQSNKQCNQTNKQLENCMLTTTIYIRQ